MGGTVTAPDPSTQKSNSKLSFHEFKEIKEDERAKNIKAKKQKAVEEVKIQIGVMEEANGHLKNVKCKTLPLMVPANITAGELLKRSNCKTRKAFQAVQPAGKLLLQETYSAD